MKKILIVGLFAVVFAGCGQQSNMESAVKERLKDPGSAQFKSMVLSKEGNYGCIEYNSKNSFGGYGDSSIASLQKISGSWVVTSMEQSANMCTVETLDGREAFDRLKAAMDREVGK